MSSDPRPVRVGKVPLTADNMDDFMPNFSAEGAAGIASKIEADRAIRAKYPGFTADVEAELVRGQTEPWYYERQPMRRHAKMARRAAELASRNAASLQDGSVEQTQTRWQAAKFWASASNMEAALWCEDEDPWYIAIPYRIWTTIRVSAQWHLWDRWRNDA